MGAPRRRALRFASGAVGRTVSEWRATFPTLREQIAFALRYCRLILTAPASPTRMSLRAQIAARESLVGDCGRIAIPTLVITGERALDRVVPIDTTLEYVNSIPGAKSAILEGTGHLGLVTRPERFSEIVGGFIEAAGRSFDCCLSQAAGAASDPAPDVRVPLQDRRI
jgi:pimeloyl-ACP methyl ester carboxylesterase